MVGHDNVFPLDPKTFFVSRLFSWIDFNLGQSQALIMGTIPIHLIDSIPSFLGFPLQTTQKIVYVYWFFLMGLSAYIFASALNKNSSIFKLTAAILYQFNFFILQGWFIGERTKFSAYIAFPLLLTTLYLVYTKKLSILKAAIINTLILLFFNGGGLYGLSLFGGCAIGVIVFLFYFSVLNKRTEGFQTAKSFLYTMSLTIGLVVLSNAYYFLPALSQVIASYKSGLLSHGGVSGFVDWAFEISASSSYLNILRLQGISDWYDNPYHPYAKFFLNNPILIIASFMWICLAILSFLFIKERKKIEQVVYFFLVFLIGVFFSAGTHAPFGFIYAFLLEHVPGFIAFRSPYFKFAPAIFLSVSFLIAFTIDAIDAKRKTAIFILFILFVFLYHFPFFTGNFFSWKTGYATRVVVPDYVYQFGAWVKNNVKDERILLLPGTAPGLQYDVYQWGFLSLQTFPTLITDKSILSNDNKLNSEENQLLFDLYAAIDRNDTVLVTRFLELLRVKYILVREDLSYNQSWTQIKDPHIYENSFKNIYGFPLLKQFGMWKLYRVNSPIFPQIFTANTLESLDGTAFSIADYLSTSNRSPLFYLKEDKNAARNLDISTIPTAESILLPCINCGSTTGQVIEFPHPGILPNSLFYPFVLLKENVKKKNPDPKSRIYDDIGLTLKRVGEIKGLISNSEQLSNSEFNHYIDNLHDLSTDIGLVNALPDKIQVAQDVHFYLTEEIVELRNLFGYPVNPKENIDVSVETTFTTIANINNQIAPYLQFTSDPSRKLYQFTPESFGTYSLLLRNSNLDGLGTDKFSIQTTWNNEEEKTVNVTAQGQWIDLGKHYVPNSSQLFSVRFPPLENVASSLSTDSFNIGISADTNCYIAKINKFENERIYQVTLSTPQVLGNYVYTYIKQIKSDKSIITTLERFSTNSPLKVHQLLLSPDPSLKEEFFGVCASNISKADLEKNLDLAISQLISPEFFLIPDKRPESIPNEVNFTMQNPTLYKLHVAANSPTVVIFSQRFDDAWQLSSFQHNHFKVLGYANGWVIDKPGDYELTLQYQPQRVFYLGLGITGIILLTSVLYLMKGKIHG